MATFEADGLLTSCFGAGVSLCFLLLGVFTTLAVSDLELLMLGCFLFGSSTVFFSERVFFKALFQCLISHSRHGLYYSFHFSQIYDFVFPLHSCCVSAVINECFFDDVSTKFSFL